MRGHTFLSNYFEIQEIVLLGQFTKGGVKKLQYYVPLPNGGRWFKPRPNPSWFLLDPHGSLYFSILVSSCLSVHLVWVNYIDHAFSMCEYSGYSFLWIIFHIFHTLCLNIHMDFNHVNISQSAKPTRCCKMFDISRCSMTSTLGLLHLWPWIEDSQHIGSLDVPGYSCKLI